MSHIPRDVKRFLKKKGTVLLIRGEPGTGKTTLALELMKNFNFAYIATGKIMGEISGSYAWMNADMKKKMFAIENQYSYQDTDSFGSAFYLLPEAIRHVLNLYESSEVDGIILDSWHSILQELNIKAMEDKTRGPIYESESFFLKILKLSDMNVKFVVVNEGNEDDQLSYMADGVVSLNRKDDEGRIYRWLRIEKLRGEEISKDFYFYTLKNARFECLKSGEFKRSSKITPFIEQKMETGSRITSVYFNELFSFRRGQTVVFDFGEYIPKSYKMTGIMGIVANFLKNGSRVVMIPPNELDMSEIKYQLYLFNLEKYYNNLVYIYGEEEFEDFSRYVDYEDDSQVLMTLTDEIDAYAGHYPPLVIIGYDRLYPYMDSRELMRMMYRIKDYVKNRGGIILMIGTIYDTEIKRFCSGIAEVYLKFKNVGGEVIMYGIKPWTPVYHLTLSTKGYPKIEKKVIV